MRRKAVNRKEQVTEGEQSKENATADDNVDKNMLEKAAVSQNSSENSGAVSKRGRKKVVTKDSEKDLLNSIVANGEEAMPTSKRGRKKVKKDLNLEHTEFDKNVNEPATDVNLNGDNVELSSEKGNFDHNDITAGNSETKRKRNINEVLMAQSKKQVKNKKANDKDASDTSESVKPVEKQVQEEENSSNKDLTANKNDDDDDFVSDKKAISGKHGKKGSADTKSKVTESKKVSQRSLKKNTEDHDIKVSSDNEIPAVSESDKKAQLSKGNRKRKNKIDSNTDPNIKHSKSKKESSDEALSLVTKEVKIILDRCEESDTANENEAVPDDALQSLKNGKGKATTKRRKGKDEEESGSKKAKATKESKEPDTSKGSSKKQKIPDVTSIDFSNDSKSKSGEPWNFKISSWNINGIRAWLEKNGVSFLHHEKPDVMCLQETKCSDDKLPEEVKKVEGYHAFWLAGDKDGYSGVGLLSKEKPLNVEYGIGVSEHDNEGRVITAEYEKFYVVAVYVPNAGRGLVRLDYRMQWDKDFCAYLKKLDEKKPIILCGDLNVAHEEIDLANPKTNKKNAGFTKEEREGFSTLLAEGYIDTFRYLYPEEKGAYTFWTYMMNARAKNVGWRLDYFVISKRFDESLCDNVIRKDVLGSDHCPITLFLSI